MIYRLLVAFFISSSCWANPCVNSLSDINADIVKYNGDSPLHSAARTNRLSEVQKLIKEKADVNKANIYGETPLMVAIKMGYEELALEFINNPSADLTLTDHTLSNALMVAIESYAQLSPFRSHAYENIISSLLAAKDDDGNYKIDRNAKDIDGRTAYELAIHLDEVFAKVRLMFERR